MKKKLDAGEYPSAQAFHNDFKLMIKNCTTFNPEGTPVNTAGRDLERLWNEKWRGLPPLHEVSDDEEEEEEESEDERAREPSYFILLPKSYAKYDFTQAQLP